MCLLSNSKREDITNNILLSESQIQLSTSHREAGQNKHKQIKSKIIGSDI